MIQTCDSPSPNGSELLPIADAIKQMLGQINPIHGTEILRLEQTHGRILAADVISTIQVPPADNSAMDGYAMKSADLVKTHTLDLVGIALAGKPHTGTVLIGQCVRIMTGAVIPPGTDSVVMQENTQITGSRVFFKQIPNEGNSVRRAGEDIEQGQIVVNKGSKLTASHLALIASVGVAEVLVTVKVKIGLIATGDELTPPGQSLIAGAIYETNRFALRALLDNFPVKLIDFGIIKDDKTQLRETFEQADSRCDLVLSCGGVSVGEADYVKVVLGELGQINFWKVAIKPGKPFAFGQLRQAWFCGLPGNPVSSYVTFEQLVTPLLQKLTGETPNPKNQFIAHAACVIEKRPGRTDYQRGIFYRDDNRKLWVKPNGKQGSGIMSSIANANCYMVLEQDTGDVQLGEAVNIQPF
jgi:molybdopterin molybdotransferase